MENHEVDVVCKWIGNGEGCRHPTIYRKSYCEKHYRKVYMILPAKKANLMIEKETESILDIKD